tara:strand:- start:516 stop:1484 length:969 start_codon:yes stop_codon:yes gene_type:complete
MVVIACTPCLASTLGPAALSVATVVGINSQKKKKKKNTKKKMKGGKKKNNLSKKIKKSCHDECEKVKKTFPTIMRKLGKQMGLDKKEIEKRIKEHNKHCEGNCIKLMKDKDIIKDIIKAMKGGGELEMTQEDYESMVREQNESMNEDRIRMIKQRQKEKERMNLELRRRLIRQEDMRKECDKLVRLLKSKGVSEQDAEKHAQKMFEQKLQCDSGKINACNYCKDEYIKNLRTSKKRSKTPQVPVQALPKSKSKSRSRPRKTTRRRKGPPESIAMKLHAMGRTSKLKNLKKSLTKRPPPPPIRRSKSKSKLKKTKSTGGKSRK